MMNKKIVIGIGIAALLACLSAGAVFATDWNDHMNYDEPQKIPFDGVVEDGELDQGSLNYLALEEFGPLLLILGLLMFSAMIGGVCIAREDMEADFDDTD